MGEGLPSFISGPAPPPPIIGGPPAARADLEKDLQLLAGYWLKDRPFVCGSRPSIADLAIACPLLFLVQPALPPRQNDRFLSRSCGCFASGVCMRSLVDSTFTAGAISDCELNHR